MRRPRKLTDERLAYIRTVIAARKVLPTHAELARLNGVSKSLIDQIAAGLLYKVPRGVVTSIDEMIVDLGLAKPQDTSNANPG